MENRIKECQLDLNADRTSTARCEQTSTPKFDRRRRRGRGGEHASRRRFGRFIQLALEEILAIWHKYSSRLRRGEIRRPRGLPKILLTPMDYCTGLLRLWNRWAQGPMFNTYIDNRGI